MARFLRALVLLIIIALVLTACSSGREASDSYDPGAPANDSAGEDFSGGTIRHVIYEAFLTVSVADVHKTTEVLTRKAESLGGYVSESVKDQSNETPSARISYRIPQAKYQEFLAFAREQGEPGRESVNSTDVTEEFVDLEARLANRLVHEERLLQMIRETASVQELLSVEYELARVREDIEVIQGRLRYLTERTTMSRVEVYLSQAPGDTEIPGLKPMGIRETLRRSLKALVSSATLFLDVISFVFIALAAVLPFALPILLLIWLILWLRRKNKSKSQGA